MYLYAPCRLLICDVRGLLAIPCTDRELMKRKMFVQKLGAYKLSLIKMWRRQGAYLLV
jgi:hypothetical protein